MKHRIILFEDDESFAEQLGKTMEDLSPDFEVIQSSTWTSTKDLMSKDAGSYDLIILDMMIAPSSGGIDDQTFDSAGLEFIRNLKSHGEHGAIPVVTLTTQTDFDQEAIAAGADLCLRKPFGSKELVDVVQSILIREDLKKQRRPIFVAHAFTKSQIDDLRSAISQALKGTSFSAYYADIEIVEGHILLDKILDKIRNTEFGIFDISSVEKANVFLELGVSIGLGKPYYLVAQSGSKIPSDLAGLDRIEYESFSQLATMIREKIINPRLGSSKGDYGAEQEHSSDK